MKIYRARKYSILILMFVATVFLISSCIDDNDGSPAARAGTPVYESITPPSAAVGTVLTLKGSGLGDMRSIVFDKNNAPAEVVSTLNTSNAIIFHVADTAAPGVQNIILTNSKGKTLSVPFQVLGFADIADVSNYNFAPGDQITLTGKNLDDVTRVVLSGTTDEATIISAASKELVIQMPATDATRAKLDIHNAAGVATTTQEFVNLDKAYAIFTDGYGAGFQDASWGSAAFVSSDEYRTGTHAVGKTYQQGNWHLIRFANWDDGVADDGYAYLSFWIKGASIEHTLYLTGDQRPAGFVNNDETTPIVVPANVWTYYKIAMEDAKLWANGDVFNQLGFWIKGPDNQDETFYFDDLILVK